MTEPWSRDLSQSWSQSWSLARATLKLLVSHKGTVPKVGVKQRPRPKPLHLDPLGTLETVPRTLVKADLWTSMELSGTGIVWPPTKRIRRSPAVGSSEKWLSK